MIGKKYRNYPEFERDYLRTIYFSYRSGFKDGIADVESEKREYQDTSTRYLI